MCEFKASLNEEVSQSVGDWRPRQVSDRTPELERFLTLQIDPKSGQLCFCFFFFEVKVVNFGQRGQLS